MSSGKAVTPAPFSHEKGGKDIATAYPPEVQLAADEGGRRGPI